MTLLPCPHCGGPASVAPITAPMQVVEEYQAYCETTGCSHGMRARTRAEVTAIWNHRAPITITTGMVAAGARAVVGRMSKRADSAMQLVANQQDMPIPKGLLDDIHAAFQAGLAMHARER